MSRPSGAPPRISPILLLSAALLTLLLVEAWNTGVTMDEPNHLLASHFYWQGGHVYHVPDLAPLLKIVTGWVPQTFSLPIPLATDPRWLSKDEWATAANWAVDQKDPFYHWLVFLCRLPVLLFPLGTAVLLWRWGSRAFGAVSGVLAAIVFALEPTALGHGVLIKNDVACAFAYLAFWYAAWRFWQAPTWKAVGWLAAATLLGVLAKLSLVILAGIAPILLLVRAPNRFPLYFPSFLAALYFGLCTAYLWDVRLLHPVEIAHKFADPKEPWLFTVVGQIFQWLPVPRYFWEGCVGLFWSAVERPPIYTWGVVRHTADPLYFLAALSVKVPVGWQVLFLAATGLATWQMVRRREALWFFLLFPPLLYVGLASFSGHQLGIRLILPALPFAALLAGAAYLHWRRFAMVAVAVGAVETMLYYPHGIAFFNAWVGGPAHGSTYLADSNLDWGQDLKSLRRWAEANQMPPLRLAYFGADTPWRYFTDKEIVSTPPPWNAALAKGKTVLEPEPGIYAISASLLPGHFFAPQYQDYYKHFRDRQPTARAGWSILIYDLRSQSPGRAGD